MNRFLILPVLFAFAVVAAPAAARPNVVLIMVDDMGFSDIGCYGSEIPTPNLDRLAADGMRFSQFYNAARCCPTRAAIMTGNYNHAVGMPGMEGPGAQYGADGKRIGGKGTGAILRESPSLGEVFRHNGYQTFIAGKWHVGEKREDQWPLQRGFDRFFGTVRGAVPNKFNGAWVMDGNRELPKPVPADWYIGNAVGEHARQYITERDKSKPFFLYYTPLEPHWPWAAPERDVAPFKGKYDAGYDVLREQRHRRAIERGVIAAATKLSPRDPYLPPWTELAKRPEARAVIELMENHAGMVKNIDDNVGRLLATLAAEGVLDRTIILFLSDNGAEAFSSYREQFRWIWMNLCNAPFRLCKHYAHEGGIATPFIVRWPGVVPAGKVNLNQAGHVMDLLPTLIEAIGGEFPKTNLGLATIPPAGQSLVAAWKDPQHAVPRTLFWEHGGNEAVRDGNWKLVRPFNLKFLDPFYDRKQQAQLQRAGGWELYDMEADRAELNNLAAQRPDKVAELDAKFAAWARSVGVTERGNRDGH